MILKSPLFLVRYSPGTLKSPTQLHSRHCVHTHTASPALLPVQAGQGPATGFRGRRRLRRGCHLQQHHVTRSCPPWRCHTGCSASCGAHTFCPEKHRAEDHETQGRTHCNLGGGQGAPQAPRSEPLAWAGGFLPSRLLYEENLKGSPNHAEPNSLTGWRTSWQCLSPRATHAQLTVSTAIAPGCYTLVRSRWREAQTVSITGDNSRKK